MPVPLAPPKAASEMINYRTSLAPETIANEHIKGRDLRLHVSQLNQDMTLCYMSGWRSSAVKSGT